MSSIRAIVDAWPSRAALAADLGAKKGAVDKWVERGRIPAMYDCGLVAAARIRGIPLTLGMLAEIRAKPSGSNYGHAVAARQATHNCKSQKGAA